MLISEIFVSDALKWENCCMLTTLALTILNAPVLSGKIVGLVRGPKRLHASMLDTILR